MIGDVAPLRPFGYIKLTVAKEIEDSKVYREAAHELAAIVENDLESDGGRRQRPRIPTD